MIFTVHTVEAREMIAQNGNMADMVAGAGDIAAAALMPTVETPARAPGDRHATIALSRIQPAAVTIESVPEYDVPNLAHASVVCSTIAKGRIVDIDSSAAFLVKGVVSILTHQNLPDIVDDDDGAGETMLPEAHYRLLRDREITFKGQPVALVVARTPEIARHAASLVRVEYETHPQAADAHPQRDAASESDDPMELGASTAIFEAPSGISIRGTVQSPQGLRQYLRGCFGLRPQFQAMLAARAALALQRSVRIVLTLQQMRDFTCAPRQAVIPGRA